MSRSAPASMYREQLRILLVSPFSPFQPRSGASVRVRQLLRRVASRHRVVLLCYGATDKEGIVADLGDEVRVEVVRKTSPSRMAKRVSQVAFAASSRPYSCREVHSPAMQRTIDAVCSTEDFDIVQLETCNMCTYRIPPGPAVVLDEHNVEYEVRKRMQGGERTLARRGFHRIEHGRLRRFEQDWWRRVSACAVTSEREEAIVLRHAPGTLTAVVANGVDLAEYRPQPDAVVPLSVVFNGLLDYRPNLDAAIYIAEEIWPLVLGRHPDARLTIVGAGQQTDLRKLRQLGVDVTGEVPDVRPYLRDAAVVAIPLRIGGGTRLKVTEALAMGKAVVSTPIGCEGILVRHGEHVLIADTRDAFASAVGRLLDTPSLMAHLGLAGRALVEARYSWDIAGQRLEDLYYLSLKRPNRAVMS